MTQIKLISAFRYQNTGQTLVLYLLPQGAIEFTLD